MLRWELYSWIIWGVASILCVQFVVSSGMNVHSSQSKAKWQIEQRATRLPLSWMLWSCMRPSLWDSTNYGFVSRHVGGGRTVTLHENALMLPVGRCDRFPRVATFCALRNHTASISCFVLFWCPLWFEVAHRRTIVMDGDGFLEPYLSFSLEAFCDGRPFSCIRGRSRTVARPDVKWRDELAEWWVD